jgi:hypothetical protein
VNSKEATGMMFVLLSRVLYRYAGDSAQCQCCYSLSNPDTVYHNMHIQQVLVSVLSLFQGVRRAGRHQLKCKRVTCKCPVSSVYRYRYLSIHTRVILSEYF